MERTYWAVVTKSGFEYRFGDNKRQAEMFAEKCNAKSAQFGGEFLEERLVRVVHVVLKY